MSETGRLLVDSMAQTRTALRRATAAVIEAREVPR